MAQVAICLPCHAGSSEEKEKHDEAEAWLQGSSSDQCLQLCNENKHTHRLQLPQPFLDYLERSGINPIVYSTNLPRYIRFKQGFESECSTVESELGVKLYPVPWLQGFFSMPNEAQIAGSQAYKLAKIFGIDAASGAAVAALGVVPEDHVLDLCAAPGAKLCMIADLLEETGTVTGVDISRHRLAACRTMLLKYGVESRCRLFISDGTEFSLLPIRHSGIETVKDMGTDSGRVLHDCKTVAQKSKHNESLLTFGEWTSKRTRRERQSARRARLQELKIGPSKTNKPELLFYGRQSDVVGKTECELFANACRDAVSASQFGYDKVLVDAECTHDGSLKHIAKYEQWGWETMEHRVLDQGRLVSISRLQLQLLTNGFKLLKAGGALVYSTCSFTSVQNEEVIEKFLRSHSNAALKEIEVASHQNWPCMPGKVMHSLRFDPLISRTSGLFIAKIIKKDDLM